MIDPYQMEIEEISEYEAFVNKFKPRKTTDDCYTPPEIYSCVRDWACAEYGIDPATIVRPFYPGGDYEHYDYPDGCTVLDNPPFSLSSKIYRFYQERGIRYFLFCPRLTAFSARETMMRHTLIFVGSDITYANGAVVPTAFATNLGGDILVRTAPDLSGLLEEAGRRASPPKNLGKYSYPAEVLTASPLQQLAKYGIDFMVHRADALPIRRLDAQIPARKTIYGTGLLLSERAAAERAAAERAAAERAAAERAAAERAAAERAATRWELSQRERALVRSLGR